MSRRDALTNVVIGLQKYANRHAVTYSVSWQFSHHRQCLQFSCFQRWGRRGSGGVFLYMILRAADQYQVPVILWTDVPRLYSWYESFGFVEWRTSLHRRHFYVYYPNKKV